MTRILVVADMQGTVNALRPSLALLKSEHGCSLQYVLSEVALKALGKADAICHTLEEDPAAVIGDFQPELVLTGITATGSNFEMNYAAAAMDAGIWTICYRDLSGVDPRARPLLMHPRSGDLLHFFTFDRMTEEVVKGWGAKNTRTVGSGFYDDVPGMDWAAVRDVARDAVGINRTDFVILFNCGSAKDRTLEVLTPTVEGLLASVRKAAARGLKLVFVPTFHPKDPDAPFTQEKSKPAVVRPSVYDPLLARLDNTPIRVVREPELRNKVANSQHRLAVADFLIMSPTSTETWTAVYGGKSQVIPALPITSAEARRLNIDPLNLDFVADRTANCVLDAGQLMHFLEHLPDNFPAFQQRALTARRRYLALPTAPPVAGKIATAILEVMRPETCGPAYGENA